MDTKLQELKDSLIQLTQNLINRVNKVVADLEDNINETLIYWLEDLSMITEVTIILSKYNLLEFDLVTFNERIESFLDKVEENDYLFIRDILQYEVKPLLSYLNGCITND